MLQILNFIHVATILLKKVIQISFLIYMTNKILFNTENEIKQKKCFIINKPIQKIILEGGCLAING